MRQHFVLGGKGADAWLVCPKHDDLYVEATGSSGFGTDEDCIGCLVAEQAWDEGATRERDAATAAVERVRAIHRPTLPGYGPKACVHDGRAWPCPTVAALDGAPEPEEKP